MWRSGWAISADLWRPSSARLAQGVEGKRDGLVGGQRPALLPRLGKGGFVEPSPDPARRLFLPCGDPCGPGHTELLAHRLREGEKPRGDFHPLREGEGSREPDEVHGDLGWITEFAVKLIRILQHQDSVLGPSLVGGETRERGQSPRFHLLVA